MDDVEVVRNPGASRFELIVGGERIGLIDYVRRGDVLTMTHTEVSQEYSGRGLAARLVEAALADAREHGESVIPQCPYVRGYIVKHPQWADLVPRERRPDFGLSA